MNDHAVFEWVPFFLGLGWIVLVISVSIAIRKKRGKPIFPKVPPDTYFFERRCSGRSLDTPWARIGGAQNCLLVALTPHALTVIPIFPFNLMFLPEIYGLEHVIDILAIREVVVRKGILGKYVTITFVDMKVRRIELRLRYPDEFARCLQKLDVDVAGI